MEIVILALVFAVVFFCLDAFKVPQQEHEEVLAAFAAHKGEVTEGSAALV